MLPYLGVTSFQIGPVAVQAWGTLVSAGFVVGTWVAARRAKRMGLESRRMWDLAFWLLLAAMVGSRVFHVFVYEPGHYLAHPIDAIDPRLPGYAIYGGFVAALFAFWIYVRRHGLDFLAWADATIWGLPWGCGVGRIGCFLIHDHPGTLSHGLLAVKYPDGQSRHDLGLYLSLVGFGIGLVFLILQCLGRVSRFAWIETAARKPGFWLGLFLMFDAASRVWLDFYRAVDVRYVGLTPTQWLTIPLVGLGAWLVGRKVAARKPEPTP